MFRHCGRSAAMQISLLYYGQYRLPRCVRNDVVGLVLLCGLLFLPLSAHAESNQEKLREIQNKHQQAKVITEELREEIDGLIEEQRDLKRDLVKVAKDLQLKEQTLTKTKLEEGQADEQLQAALSKLDARRGELEAMIQASVRMSQVPPEAMIMMPNMNGEAMQMARTMRIMADTLSQRAAQLRAEITTLRTMRSRVQDLREQTEKQLARVKEKRQQVNQKLTKRKALTKKLNAQLGGEKSRMAQLAKEAKNLNQLMASIKKNQRRKKPTPQIKGGVQDVIAYVEAAMGGGGSKGKIRSFASQKGKLRAPSSGKVVGQFKSKGTGELSKGLTIETISSAAVNAPFDGKVAYVGSFRGYGNMVILKHSDDYFTLLAGLKEISASENEVLLEGEPIGAMGSSGSRKLYVELRKGSDPINPSGWFAGL